MREIQQTDCTIFEDRPIVLPAILAIASLVFAFGLTSHIPALLAGEKEAIGMVLGLLLCAFGAVLLFRRDRFVFDAAHRQLRWSKWSLARASSGAVDFADILDVTMESIGANEGSGSYRVALRTKDSTVPLTETYSGDADYWRPLVERLRGIVGLAADREADADTQSLLEQGRIIDAVRQLRETEGLSTTQAKARVGAVGREAD